MANSIQALGLSWFMVNELDVLIRASLRVYIEHNGPNLLLKNQQHLSENHI